MLRTASFIFAVLCIAILIGCSKTEMTNNNSNANRTVGSTDKQTTAPEKTMASSGEKIGVPECDDFIAKYDACLSKVPEVARAQYKNALAQWREQWRGLAQNPQTKATLVSVCKQAAEQQAAALKSYGCGF